MFSFRALSLLMFLFAASFAQPVAAASFGSHVRPDAALERPAPSLSGKAQQTQLAAQALQDRLRLSTGQVQALKACTVVELRELGLATTPAQVARAQRQHLRAAGRILTPSQLQQFLELRQDFTDKLLFADAQ